MSENLTKFFKTILLYQNIADTLIYSNINFKDLRSLRIKLFAGLIFSCRHPLLHDLKYVTKS